MPDLSAAQTLATPAQVATVLHQRNLSAGQTLLRPTQYATAVNLPPRAPRQPPAVVSFNAIPVPDGTLPGAIAATQALKDMAEQLVGIRGDGSKQAVLKQDLQSDAFLSQHGLPIGMVVLLPVTTPLPNSWAETTLASPDPGLRYIQKL